MRWRRRTSGPDGQSEELRSAQEMLREAENELEAVHKRTSEIREISRTLRRLGEQNHFAPLVWRAFGGESQ